MLDEMTFFEVFRWVISSSKHTSLVSEEKMVLPKYFTKKTVLHPQVSRFVSTLYLHTPHHDDGSHFSNLGRLQDHPYCGVTWCADRTRTQI